MIAHLPRPGRAWLGLKSTTRRLGASVPRAPQSIQRTGPDLLTDAAEHVGVKRGKDKLFSKADCHIGGLGE